MNATSSVAGRGGRQLDTVRAIALTHGPIPPRELTWDDSFDGMPAARRRGADVPENTGTLRRGSSGSVVYELQEILGVEETGLYDAATEAAVRRFQRENGVEADGWVGAHTAELMGLTLGDNVNVDLDSEKEAGRAGHWDDDVEPTNSSTLRSGSTGAAVKAAQRKLGVRQTGTYDAATETAVRKFQKKRGLEVDGWVGTQTAAALGIELVGTSSGSDDRPSSGARELHATIDEVKQRGSRTQMILGRITVNGRTYKYRSGGHGRGSLPPGRYTLTPHLWTRDNRSMSVGGVGFSFALSDKYDPRVGGTRSALRVHPDGGGAGTIGCIGIIGNGETMRRFREDVRALFNRRGNSLTLTVG